MKKGKSIISVKSLSLSERTKNTLPWVREALQCVGTAPLSMPHAQSLVNGRLLCFPPAGRQWWLVLIMLYKLVISIHEASFEAEIHTASNFG